MAHRRTREILARIGLPITLGGALLAAATAVHGCADEVTQPIRQAQVQGAGVGDPCFPLDEANPGFPGFGLSEINIEDRFNGCLSGLCLAYHFQGRVDCPLGQPALTPCQGPGDTSCGSGGTCAASDAVYMPCDPSTPDGGAPECGGGACDPQRMTCTCTANAQCPSGSACDPLSHRCAHFVCRNNAGCQVAGASDADNAGKGCCADGSGAPISTAVCGQCAADSPRAAANAVYCSCRCALAAGDPADAGDLCACPDGFACTEIRPYIPDLPIPDQYAGSYCIKAGAAWDGVEPPGSQCGAVRGYHDSICGGN